MDGDTVGAFDAKTNFSRLLERAEKGETITITKHGRPVAKLVPVNDEAARQRRREAIEKIKEFAKSHTLGGPDIKAMINEGRK